ncbi:unnamed protein product [Bathycoccus prasinos]
MTTQENKITLESIHDYFWTPVGTERKPQGWVIDGALYDEKPGTASESRIRAYFGSKNNYKSGFLYDFFTTHMGVGCCENVRDYFLPHTLQDAINKLDLDVKHYKNGKLNKKSLNYLKALFVVLDDYPAFDSFDASHHIVHLERTRMTDIETKWRKDRARLLVRVKAGAVPNEDSQEKYKLSLAEINVVRVDAGLPELDRPYRVNAFAGMMAINAETERLQGEVLEQMNLTQNLRDDVRGLDQRMKQMVVEEQGRRVVVPAGEQFTLETIHDHFWMPVGTEGKPRGWEIDRAGKRASETTIKIRFGSKKNYRSGQIYNFFTKYMSDECFKNVRNCLKRAKLEPVLTKIREDELANPITTLNYLQALFVLLNNYPGLLPEFKPDLDWLNSFNAKAKLATSAYIAEKTKYTIPFNFTQIRELFEDRFGKNTDPYTYISIYGEAPSRDDWGMVMINPPAMDGQKEKKMNYIVRGDDGIWTFFLNVYKTAKFFDFKRFDTQFSPEVSKIIDAHIKRNKYKDGDYIFGKPKKGGGMSSIVTGWLIDAGVKDGLPAKETETPGAINILRHAYVTEYFPDSDRQKLSEALKHSPLTTPFYVREIDPKLTEKMLEIQKNKISYEEREPMIMTRSKTRKKN